MSKKLISLVPSSGKDPNELAKQTWDNYVHYQATKLGLKICRVCGEYKGTAKDKGETLTVLCICDGIKCTHCKKVTIRRPISNHFSAEDAKIWHTPYFAHICRACRA